MSDAEAFWRDVTKDLRPQIDTRFVDRQLVEMYQPIPDWVRVRVDPMDPLGQRYEVGRIKAVPSSGAAGSEGE